MNKLIYKQLLLAGNPRNVQHRRNPHASTDASDCADVQKQQGTQRQRLAEGRRASTDNSQPPDGETGVAPVSGLLKAEVNSPSDTLNNYHPMEACRNPLIENKELLRDNKQLRKQLAAEHKLVEQLEGALQHPDDPRHTCLYKKNSPPSRMLCENLSAGFWSKQKNSTRRRARRSPANKGHLA